ncbi:MAG: serine/threonine-protein kinase [Thermoanaerobaculia bacterium]|nr:serine/threonine-protein kinase [Thermoanaerobaculia bacterium]
MSESRREASEIPSSFLAEPADLTLETLDERNPRSIPAPPSGGVRYAVEGLLGRGGMASVYRAFDRQLERPVALKVLDGAFAEPYLQEARAQARVRHDNVLEVYEAGELEGRPYIAMRFVAGPSLLELKRLPLEPKLRLLAQVAEGLHAAHRAGLLHRDVKPSNILVERLPDGDLRPYVADFGIALALEASDSGAAPLAGTPGYMAPEQLRGDGPVDRRADVYGLGATACELLTGRLPGGQRALEPLLAPLPREVAAIVRKCLAAEPPARYPSARSVAEDLHRYLNGEVVEAHAAGLAHRLTKLVLRHRVLAAVIGLATLGILTALVVAALSGWSAIRANERAVARREQAEALIEFMLGDLRTKLQATSRLELLDAVGDKALDYFAAVPPAELSVGELSRWARALYQIGDVRIRQGNLAAAKEPLGQSLALAAELVERSPDASEPLFELGQSHFWVGYVAWKQRDFSTASRHFLAYRDISRRLAAAEPDNADYRLELHYATSNLGSLLEGEGQLTRAVEAFQEALAVIEPLVAADPTRADRRFELAAAHNALGAPLLALGRPAEALEHFLADVAIREQLVAAAPQSLRDREFLAVSQVYVAKALLALGRAAEAEAQAGQAVRSLEALVAEDVEHAERQFRLAAAVLESGRAALARGLLDQAETAFRRHLKLVEKLSATNPADEAWRRQLGVAHVFLGRMLIEKAPQEARRAAERALKILAPATTPGSSRPNRWAAEASLLLAELEAAAGRPDGARAAVEQALTHLGPEAEKAEDAETVATWERAAVQLAALR